MSVEEQVASLKARHAELEEALSQERARPLPDAATISDLKKRKLRIKDELAKLTVAAG